VEAGIRGFFATCGALHDLPSLLGSLFPIVVSFCCRTEDMCLMDVIFFALRMSFAPAAGIRGTI